MEHVRAKTTYPTPELSFKVLFDCTLDGIAIVDDDGHCLDINAGGCELIGITKSALINRSLMDLWDAAPTQKMPTRAHEWAPRGELRLRHTDGLLKDVEYTLATNALPGIHILVLRDVTDRNDIEAKRRKAESRAAVAALSTMFVHDINNALSFIIGSLQLAQMAAKNGGTPEQRDTIIGLNLTRAMLGAQQINSTIKSLKGTPCVNSAADRATEMEGLAGDIALKQGPDRRRVLIVDDSLELAEILRDDLGRSYDVVITDSAMSAFRLLENDRKFDVIFCDLLMPGKSGMDLFHMIQHACWGIHQRIIFMSGDVCSQRPRDFLATVDNDYIEKPIGTADLRRLVDKWCNGGECKGENER